MKPLSNSYARITLLHVISGRSSLRGYGLIGVHGGKNPIETYMACWEWGKYLGDEALSSGVDVCISSWNRIAPNTLPALAKAGGNY